MAHTLYCSLSLPLPLSLYLVSNSPLCPPSLSSPSQDDASDSQKQCKQLACNIQWCLARRGHIEARCKDFIEAWDKCVKEADAAQALREKREQH